MYLGLAAALAAWYNVARHYTGPERSGVAIHPEGAISGGYGIMSLDIIPARSEAEWPSTPKGPCPSETLCQRRQIFLQTVGVQEVRGDVGRV